MCRFTVSLQNEVALLHRQIDRRQSVLIGAVPIIAQNIDRFGLESRFKRRLITFVRGGEKHCSALGWIQIVRRQGLVLFREPLLFRLACDKVRCCLHHRMTILRLLEASFLSVF